MHFSNESRCIVYGSHADIAQNMLDYDFLCGRGPSVAAFFSAEGGRKQHKLFYGDKEFFVPTICSWEEVDSFQMVDTLINLASFRSCTTVNKQALASKKFTTIFTIAEGVPERESRELIALASNQTTTTLLGPSIVGGLVSGIFKIGNTGGSLDNILQSRLYQAGSVGVVSKSGGMMNELCRVASNYTNGVHTALQVGGDRFPMSTFKDILQYFEKQQGIDLIILLGEVGNKDEIVIAEMIKAGELSKPIVARCIGSSAEKLTAEVQFGHAGAKANSQEETATYKNNYLRDAGAYVPESYDSLGEMLGKVYLEQCGGSIESVKPQIPAEILRKVEIVRNRSKTNFTSTISDDRGEELSYNGVPISKFVEDKSLPKVIGHLRLKKELPDYACNFLTTALILLADHGPAVSGATNTIVTARAGKDLVSSLIAGLATVGPRFGGAIDGSARRLSQAIHNGYSATEVIFHHKQQGSYIQGVGHKVKSKYNPDARCILLEKLASTFPVQSHFTLAKEVETLTLEKNPNLILNVDGHIAAMFLDIMVDIGMSHEEIEQYIQIGLFNGFFILARSIGFIGHYLDQQRLSEGLYRTPWDDILYTD